MKDFYSIHYMRVNLEEIELKINQLLSNLKDESDYEIYIQTVNQIINIQNI